MKTRRGIKAGFIPAVTQRSNTKRLHARRHTGWGPAGKRSVRPILTALARDLRPYPRSERSQALIEFALISPVLLLLLFGVVDLGRAVFYYDMVAHAAREGARTAVHATTRLPTNADVLASVTTQMNGTAVTQPCPQGPISSATPPANAAWLYVTEPTPPVGAEVNPPMNAPGGEYSASASGGCSAANPAANNAALQVTIRYNLILITPVISQATANHIVIIGTAIFRTEY